MSPSPRSASTISSPSASTERGFERRARFVERGLRLRYHLSHGDEAVDLAVEAARRDGDALRRQSLRVSLALVEKRIVAGGENPSRRDALEAGRAEGRGAPVRGVGVAAQVMAAEPRLVRGGQQIAL